MRAHAKPAPAESPIVTHIAPNAPPFPAWLIAELRSDHAGEAGAVRIYRGILAVTKNPALRAFAANHGATEQTHLDLIETLLPPAQRSRLLPLWHIAGWLTGALPALFGPLAVYATIDAVETFVDHHYQQQIARLDAGKSHPAIRALLENCRQDEVHHRDEARGLAQPAGVILKLWCRMVAAGSEAAVGAARRI
jgi:ubiquinone biosynthesis monooxygenase Coq7